MSGIDMRGRLQAFNAELQRLAEAGDGRDVLAWTGEELARAAEDLRKSAVDDRSAYGVLVFYVAGPHIGALYDAGMGLEALATSSMVLMTCLIEKVDPEKIPAIYTSTLQGTFAIASALADDPSLAMRDPDGHLVRIAAMYGALACATADRIGPDNLPEQICAADADIRSYIASLPPDMLTFGGKQISATMALDIAADATARLKALGVE